MNATYCQPLERRRRSLGISFTALSDRSGISVPTLKRIFSGQVSPTLDKLQAIATVLAVEIRTGDTIEVVPTKSVEEVRRAVAEQKARWLVELVQGTSALEAQAVDQDAFRDMIDRTIHELMAGPNRKLWAAR